jgi:peptide deformylase
MALLTVLQYPDPRVHDVAVPVAEIDEKIRRMVNDMFETMYDHNGVGLASIQVNIKQRIVVMDVSDDRKNPICAINPEIIYSEKIQTEFEGCLSYPGVYEKIERPFKAKFRALDIDGKPYEMEGEGLFAACIHHEVDHLNGRLFVQRLSRLKQDRARKKLEKIRRQTL